jgi:hypothetical protein
VLFAEKKISKDKKQGKNLDKKIAKEKRREEIEKEHIRNTR